MILKFKSLIPFIFASVLAISTQSCFDGDDYDFDKLSDQVDWTPNLIVPAGYGTYSLWYLLNQHEIDPADQSIELDSEGFLHVTYSEEDIFNYNVADVIDFPTQTALDLSYSLPNLGIGIRYDLLPTFAPQTKQIQMMTDGASAIKIYELDLNANLIFYVSNPLNTTIDLLVSIPNGTEGGAAINESFEIPAITTNQREILSFSDLNLLFNTPYTTDNEFDIVFEISIRNNGSGVITGSGDIGISLEVQNIDFQLAQGDFGNQTIDIGTGSIDMDVDLWDDIEGDYQFANPQISLLMENSIGVPFEINANIEGYASDGTSVSLNPDAMQPDYPRNVSASDPLVIDAITDVITYHKNNSSIVDLMALPPSDRLEYSGNISLNPAEAIAPTPTTPNLISNNSEIGLDIKIDIPLDFTANKLTLRDTINDLDITDTDKIMNAAVVVVTENGYPLAVMIDKIYFTDAAYTRIDSISDENVINAATVFASGAKIGEVDPSSIVQVEHQIKLTESQIKNLDKTKNLIINASVSTNNGGVPVKLKGDYELKFTLSVQAQIDLNN